MTTKPKVSEHEKAVIIELEVLLGEYAMTGDDERIVNVLEEIDKHYVSKTQLREVLDSTPQPQLHSVLREMLEEN